MKKLIPCCIFLALTGCNNADQEAATTQPVEQPTPIATTSEPSAPPAPSVSYESLLISGDAAGPFTVENDGFSTLNYYSRAGALNLMEAVTQDYEYLGYGVFQDSCHCLHAKPLASLATLFPGSVSSGQQACSS
jgi:hypothetical protein